MGRSGRSNKISSVGVLTRSQVVSANGFSASAMNQKQLIKLADNLGSQDLKKALTEGREFEKVDAKIQLLNLLIEKSEQDNPPKEVVNLLKRAEKKTGLTGKKALLKLRYLENIKELEKSQNRALKDLGVVLQNASGQTRELLFLNEVAEAALLTGENQLIKKTAQSLKEIEEETRDQATIKDRPETKVVVIPSFRMVSKANRALDGEGGLASGVNIRLENGENLIFLSAESAINQARAIHSPEFESQRIDDLNFLNREQYLQDALQDTLRHELIHSSQLETPEKLNDDDQSIREGLTEALNISLRKGWSKNKFYQREVKAIEAILKPFYPDEYDYVKVLKHLNTIPFDEAKEFLSRLKI